MIDELAEVGDKDTLDLLSSILRIGRSFRVNVVAATQLPTKATCGEKNNYTVRFVGAVTDPETAALAAGRGESGAHLLPGKGRFCVSRAPRWSVCRRIISTCRERRRWCSRRCSGGETGGERPVTGAVSRRLGVVLPLVSSR